MKRIIAGLVTAGLLFGVWSFVGKPMWDTYQQTGKVAIPGVGSYDVSGVKDVINDTLGDLTGSSSTGNSGTSGGKVDASAVLRKLEALPVKGKAPMTGYDRELFPHWSKSRIDGVTCDTRNRVLKRDLVDPVIDTNKCTVLSGRLNDKYTGKTINFQRGPKSGAVQIDHVVALGNAWETGAQSWDKDKRQKFANAGNNLLAVDGPANGQKGKGDAATWLPSNRSVWCSYTAAQVNVKSEYGLWVTKAEKDKLTEILSKC